MDRDRSGSRVPHYLAAYVEIGGVLVEVGAVMVGGVTKGEAIAVAILAAVALVAIVLVGALL